MIASCNETMYFKPSMSNKAWYKWYKHSINFKWIIPNQHMEIIINGKLFIIITLRNCARWTQWWRRPETQPDNVKTGDVLHQLVFCQ